MERMVGKDDVLPLFTPLTTKSGKVINSIPVPKGLHLMLSVAGYNTYVTSIHNFGTLSQPLQYQRSLGRRCCRFQPREVVKAKTGFSNPRCRRRKLVSITPSYHAPNSDIDLGSHSPLAFEAALDGDSRMSPDIQIFRILTFDVLG